MQDRKGIVSQSITSAENDTGWTLCSRILFTKKEKEKVFFLLGRRIVLCDEFQTDKYAHVIGQWILLAIL